MHKYRKLRNVTHKLAFRHTIACRLSAIATCCQRICERNDRQHERAEFMAVEELCGTVGLSLRHRAT